MLHIRHGVCHILVASCIPMPAPASQVAHLVPRRFANAESRINVVDLSGYYAVATNVCRAFSAFGGKYL
jgi:hypothetical protein